MTKHHKTLLSKTVLKDSFPDHMLEPKRFYCHFSKNHSKMTYSMYEHL